MTFPLTIIARVIIMTSLLAITARIDITLRVLTITLRFSSLVVILFIFALEGFLPLPTYNMANST